MEEVKTPETKPAEPKYTKEALMASRRYQDRRDLLQAVLADGESYTIAEAEKKLNAYLRKEV